MSDKSHPEKEMLVSAHSLRVLSIMVEKAWQQECKAAVMVILHPGSREGSIHAA